MLESKILDEALQKKNKEIERLLNQQEDTKKSYEAKIKNLMNSINNLKSQNQNLENTTKDNIRVSIINKLKEERKDQEYVIELLRKLISDEDRVDKYLIKEFDKKGTGRIATYEELKIKIKQLESEIVSLKYKQVTNTKNKSTLINKQLSIENFQENGEDKSKFDNNSNQLQIQKLKEQIITYEETVRNLTEENESLTTAKEKLEKMQNELFDRLKNYNKEIGEMKSIYDVIKKNLEDESNLKINDLMTKLARSEEENNKLKSKIKELIEISEGNNIENLEKIKKLNSENEVLKRLLESKKEEIEVVLDELSKYQMQLEKDDTKVVGKYKKNEIEIESIKRKNFEYEEKIKFHEKLIKQKDYQLDLYKKSLSEKDEIIAENQLEIEMLQSKIQELENIVTSNSNLSS
jgi:chromosome segregation ATPase